MPPAWLRAPIGILVQQWKRDAQCTMHCPTVLRVQEQPTAKLAELSCCKGFYRGVFGLLATSVPEINGFMCRWIEADDDGSLGDNI